MKKMKKFPFFSPSKSMIPTKKKTQEIFISFVNYNRRKSLKIVFMCDLSLVLFYSIIIDVGRNENPEQIYVILIFLFFFFVWYFFVFKKTFVCTIMYTLYLVDFFSLYIYEFLTFIIDRYLNNKFSHNSF